jgi:hypothetical protein
MLSYNPNNYKELIMMSVKDFFAIIERRES